MPPSPNARFGRLRRRLGRSDGNVAILFALLLIPLIGAVGLAIDSLRAYLLEDELQQALDAAALAAGRVIETGDLAREAQQVFDANFASARGYASVGNLDIRIDDEEGTIELAADARLPTVFMRILGTDNVSTAARTVVSREIRQMELVLVMDNTGSMGSGNAIGAEIAAARMLIENVYGADETHDNLLVGLVPYTATVNIGPAHKSWLEPGDQVFDWPNGFTLAQGPDHWKGCVMARPAPLDQTDDPPGVKRFTSFLYPPDIDNLFPPVKERITDENTGTGPNLGCGWPPILSLTPEKSKVLAEINKMGAWYRGGTTSNLGLAWGWRVLSPRWRGLWGGNTPADRPVDYNSELSDKVIVLLTDGNNEFYDWNQPEFDQNKKEIKPGTSPDGPRGSDMTAYGRLFDLGVGSLGAGKTLLDKRMAALCTSIKKEGVIMYTITFGATPDKATKTMYQTCATTPDYYFHAPDQATMKTVFKRIGRQLGNLRISH